jgi:RIO kinase 1
MLEASMFDHFASEGLIGDVIRPIRSGKEAAVYLCSGGSAVAHDLLALKVYHERRHRAFRNDAIYKDGRVILNERDRRAVAKKTPFGRALDEHWWVHGEYEALATLHAAGADVPEPVASNERAVLMSYVGDAEASAPQLRHASIDREEARALLNRLMWNVELFLAHNVVHADLSAFNVLWWGGRPTIIDFPQSVDPRKNPNASDLLTRDVANVCRFFTRFGIEPDPVELAENLWIGFLFAEL